VLTRSHVALPKGPSATLSRPHRINGATGGPVVKDAIAVRLLPQAPTARGGSRVQAGHLLDCRVPVPGKGRDFLFIDPGMTRRSGAAMAAPGAAKAKPVLVP